MTQKRSKCLCGYEGRYDHYLSHLKKCEASRIIESLQEEVKRLKTENEILQKMKGNTTVTNTTVTNVTNNLNVNNLTIYGAEHLPNALKEIQRLCKSGDFENVVPRYIEMKHFTDGIGGNIRIVSNKLQIFNEEGWVNMDKKAELARLTDDNAEEVIDRYGEKSSASFFKRWHGTHNMNDRNSNNFKDVQKKVEQVIKNNSATIVEQS